MSKRFVGIDLEGGEARVAILSVAPGRTELTLDKRGYDRPDEAADAIREMLGGTPALGDRLVTALPCRVGLFRRLRFPFREKRKLEEALPLELASRLPVLLEEHLIEFLPPRAREKDYEVDAVVVNGLEVDDLLTHFPEPEQNPRRIDYFPFALLPALAEQEGILVYCRRLEVVVALVYDGMIWDYRLLPGTAEYGEGEILDFIANQISQLENAVGRVDFPLWVIGAGVSEAMLKELQGSGRTILSPGAEVFNQPLDCAMAPAALLALAEMRLQKKTPPLNFRKGEFAARGQLEAFRRKLAVAATLLLLVLVGGAAAMHFNYLLKSRDESQLRNQLGQLFRQTMPAGTPQTDVPLQLEAHLKELQQQVQLFGLGGQGAATVLQNLSQQIAPDVRVELREFVYSGDEVRLDGQTDSFDAVNRIAELLKKNPRFTQVEISNARLAADSSTVDFELQLKLDGGGAL